MNEPRQQSALLEMLQTVVNTRLQNHTVNLQLLLLLKSLKMKHSQYEATCGSRREKRNSNNPSLPAVREFRVTGNTKVSQEIHYFFISISVLHGLDL